MRIVRYHYEALVEATVYLSKGKFWIYFLPSILVAFLFYQSNTAIAGLKEDVQFLEKLPWIGSWLVSKAEQAIVLLQGMVYFVFQFVVLTVLSPVNTLLSERVEEEHIGTHYPFNFWHFVLDILRAVFVILFSTASYFFFLALWWLLSFVPFLSLLDEVMYFLIASFFLGFSFYDYSLERHRKNFFHTWAFAFQRLGFVVMTGALFSLIFLLPFSIGLLLAPFIVTIVSTLVYLKIEQKTKQNAINSTTNDATDV